MMVRSYQTLASSGSETASTISPASATPASRAKVKAAQRGGSSRRRRHCSRQTNAIAAKTKTLTCPRTSAAVRISGVTQGARAENQLGRLRVARASARAPVEDYSWRRSSQPRGLVLQAERIGILKLVAQERFDDLNAGFVQELFAEYLASPDTVDDEWRALFEAAPQPLLESHPLVRRLRELQPDAAPDGDGDGAVQAERAAPQQLLGGVAAAMSLIKAHRTHGHLAARLDPLGSEPPGDPALDPDRLVPSLTPELQRRIPAKLLRLSIPGETLADVLPRLQETYCGTIAYEIEHISDHEQRVWLRQAIETGRYRRPLPPDERRALLERLSQTEGFEQYLRRAFLGQKQFSIEGLDVMVPMLDESIELAADAGAHEAVIGMAHRGRLNVLAHTVGRPYELILREFEGERTIEAVVV